jgi:predicted CoA-binding protein
MAHPPTQVAAFLAGRRLAVAGVSRDPRQPANLIFRKLRSTGYEVAAVNPNATTVEGGPCFASLRDVPGVLDGLVIAVPPAAAESLVREAAAVGVRRVWLHRSFGTGSVSADAVRACEALGIDCIAGGCPMMYCAPVDIGHKCMRWLLRLAGKVPG